MKRDIETRADIDDLMDRFYGKALSDETIGYIFGIVKLDLKHHLPLIGDFWETMLLGTGSYQKHGRNPMQIHDTLDRKTLLRAEHFRRWLEIFCQTIDESFAGERAELVKFRAEAVANRMLIFVGSKSAMEV